MFLKCFVNDSEMLFNNFEKLSNDFEMFFNDLSTSLNNVGSLNKLQRRGGGLRPPSPFVVFFAPKIIRTAA